MCIARDPCPQALPLKGPGDEATHVHVEWGILPQVVVTTMCPVLPPATAIKKFDRQNEGLIV